MNRMRMRISCAVNTTIATLLLLCSSTSSWAFSTSNSSAKLNQKQAVMSEIGRKTFIGSLLSAAIILPKPSPAEAANLPPTGASAPYFELPSSIGETKSLETLTKTGKWTVLYFYPGAFTSGCTLEARGFQRDIDQYRSLNTQIVGVSVDAPEKNAQFCKEEQLDFYMLSDKGGKVSKMFGSALSIPGFGTFSNRQTYLIDPQGSLRWVFTDVESHVPRHSAEVLEKISEIQKEGIEV